ncbi:hypothetical protein [Actinoplanes teichomyceticus]|uniref:Uncharacterized protein n=1 Tax=Actinoplanes teichomyceticus TaxID=1867 RepID=A0A561VGQ0_ACTTI|nr:hypothetical protein [Actinoplanes teichomyceticus]TWG10802.1 hypothetical protein FHX34_107299 [Actinoplanes teichomyceticus]GIF12577.1 hypothetical protein Ate01nite_26090 [Actinoplanes teichomyceticus]
MTALLMIGSVLPLVRLVGLAVLLRADEPAARAERAPAGGPRAGSGGRASSGVGVERGPAARAERGLAWIRIEHAGLLAAARATLAAHPGDEEDLFCYVRDEVAAQRKAR